MQQVVKTSPYYHEWVKTAEEDLKLVKQAIKNKDFSLLGEVSEASAMKMHALNMSAKPHFSYFMPESILAMQKSKNYEVRAFLAITRWMRVQTSKSSAKSKTLPSSLTNYQNSSQKKIFWSQTPDPAQDLSDFSMVPAESGETF